MVGEVSRKDYQSLLINCGKSLNKKRMQFYVRKQNAKRKEFCDEAMKLTDHYHRFVNANSGTDIGVREISEKVVATRDAVCSL